MSWAGAGVHTVPAFFFEACLVMLTDMQADMQTGSKKIVVNIWTDAAREASAETRQKAHTNLSLAIKKHFPEGASVSLMNLEKGTEAMNRNGSVRVDYHTAAERHHSYTAALIKHEQEHSKPGGSNENLVRLKARTWAKVEADKADKVNDTESSKALHQFINDEVPVKEKSYGNRSYDKNGLKKPK